MELYEEGVYDPSGTVDVHYDGSVRAASHRETKCIKCCSYQYWLYQFVFKLVCDDGCYADMVRRGAVFQWTSCVMACIARRHTTTWSRRALSERMPRVSDEEQIVVIFGDDGDDGGRLVSHRPCTE